jgi:hypothetical protein
MALLDVGTIYRSADDSDIMTRFMAACLIAAKDIRAENPATENHTQRLSWANGMFSSDMNSVISRTRQHLRLAIATNSTFQSSGNAVTDNDIGFMVASNIDALSNG